MVDCYHYLECKMNDAIDIYPQCFLFNNPLSFQLQIQVEVIQSYNKLRAKISILSLGSCSSLERYLGKSHNTGRYSFPIEIHADVSLRLMWFIPVVSFLLLDGCHQHGRVIRHNLFSRVFFPAQNCTD